MSAEQWKVRLNDKYPKEEASTFTRARKRTLSLLPFLYTLFASFPLLIHLPKFSLPCLHLLLTLFSCALPSLFLLSISLFPPRATVSDPDTFVSLSLCHSFKQRRRSGHTDVPGAPVTVPSQVNVSQRVLDDTLRLSPISLLLISVVSSEGSKDS